jgi:vitamin B12 transporter
MASVSRMHRLPLGLLCTVLLLADQAGAAEHPEAAARLDSASGQYRLPEIVVTGHRLPTRREESSAALNVITEADLMNSPGELLASVLTPLSGVFVRPYGGGGALQTVSFRGMAAEHTVLIVDNQRINSVQNGQADFGILSRMNLERVEVVRGGYSSLYGADAMGGVVRAFTKRPARELSLHASLGVGSAGLFSRELGLSGSSSGVGILLSLRTERGNGRYPYDYTGGAGGTTRQDRLGADHDIVEASARVTWLIQPDLETDLIFRGINADRGVPGPVVRPDDPGGARLSDKSARWCWTSTWHDRAGLTARLVASLDATSQNYTDPTMDLGAQGVLTSTSDVRVYRIAPELEHSFAPWVEGVVGAEFQHAQISGSDVGESARRQWSLWYSLRISGGLSENVLHDVSLLPSLRYDRFSDFGEAWSPKLGLSLTPVRVLPVRLRASYGESFRAPTFNELHWIPGGNPALRPERSTGFDAGLIGTVPLAGELRVEAGVFSGETRDRILWLPGSGGIWSPENIGRVTTRGVELEATWFGFNGILGVTVNSTWLDARKASSNTPGDPTVGNYLLYVPQQTVNASINLHTGPVNIRAQHNWVSFRYTSEANDRVLPSYGVTNASAQIRVPLSGTTLTIAGEINNVFNESYEVMPQYPMPLRTFRGSLGVDL